MLVFTSEYRTRFNPATDTKGESITLFHNGRQKTFAYNYSLDGFDNHIKLVEKAWAEFWYVKEVKYSSVSRVKDLKHGYIFKAYIEIKD